MKRYTKSLCSTMLLLEYIQPIKFLEFTMLLVIKKRHSGILYNAKAKVNLKPP
jgi:hypothetical protein